MKVTTCKAGFKPLIRASSGFTLLEVLVSLTIMALITGVAFAGFSIAIDSWHRGSRKIEELDNRFALERVIQRQIAMMDHIVSGDRNQLEFTTTYSIANGSGDPVWVKYVLDANHLMYSETPMTQYVPDQSTTPVVQTFDAVSTNGFQYLYSVPGEQYDWFVETMKDNPRAVRVDISGDVLTIPLVNNNNEGENKTRISKITWTQGNGLDNGFVDRAGYLIYLTCACRVGTCGAYLGRNFV